MFAPGLLGMFCQEKEKKMFPILAAGRGDGTRPSRNNKRRNDYAAGGFQFFFLPLSIFDLSINISPYVYVVYMYFLLRLRWKQ